RAAIRAVLASIPEEQAVEDLVVLVPAAELDGVVAELREEVFRLPREVGALQGVLVDRALGAVADGAVGPARGEGVHAADPPLQGAEACRVADVQAHFVRVLEPIVGLVHGPERPLSVEAGVARGRSEELGIQGWTEEERTGLELPEAERLRKSRARVGGWAAGFPDAQRDPARAGADLQTLSLHVHH